MHTADFDGCFEFEEDWLVDEDLACAGAEILDLIFLELDRLSGSISTDYNLQVSPLVVMEPRATFGAGMDRICSQMAPVASWGDSPSSKRSMTESRSISVVDSAINVIQLRRFCFASLLILASARKRLCSPGFGPSIN